MNSIRVEFTDGYTMITSGNAIRRKMMHDEESTLWKTPHNIALIKGMILRGDRQSDILGWFGNCNPGRIAEIKKGAHGAADIEPASVEELPPPGPPPILRVIADDPMKALLEDIAPVLGQYRDHLAKTQGDDVAQPIRMLLTRTHAMIDHRKRELWIARQHQFGGEGQWKKPSQD